MLLSCVRRAIVGAHRRSHMKEISLRPIAMPARNWNGHQFRQNFSVSKECPDCGGTVTKYDRHILVYTGSASALKWPSKLEAEDSGAPVVYALTKELKRSSAQLGDLKVKVTAVSADPEPHNGAVCNAQVFPGGSRFALSQDNIVEFVQREIFPEGDTQSQLNSPAAKKLILVCVHATRDKLCGTKGPALQVPCALIQAIVILASS